MRIRELFHGVGKTAAVPRSEVLLLVAYVMGVGKSWVIAHDERELDAETFNRIASILQRRSAGEPISYITAAAGFYGRDFLVSRSVLIPRPETEHLIDEALDALQRMKSPAILDVGTGCGAIACTLAAESARCRVDAVDISREALDVARENAHRLGVKDRVTFSLGNLLEPVADNRYDVVIANLPYVPTAEIAPAPNPVSFEPVLALDGGADGLDLYRRLLGGVRGVLKPGGLLLMEAAPPTIDGLTELARKAFPHAAAEIGLDYGGRRRYVKVTT